MELADRIATRVAERTGEAEMLRKQLADAKHELERLVIAGQVIAQRSGVSGCWCRLAARHPVPVVTRH
jgi:hypothetical protein